MARADLPHCFARHCPGRGPKLRYLHLSAVTRADSLLNALSTDLPALEELHVSLCCQDELAGSPYLAANSVSMGLWPALEKLSLPDQRLGLHSMVPVVHTGWAKLQELELSSKFLHEESIDCLVACNWPCLTWLSPADNQLDASAIQALITGDWPLLQDLFLCSNEFCEEACQHLARGAWPQLTTIDLSDCGLDLCCFCHLLKGCWPGLEELVLTSNNLKVQEVYSVAQDIVDQRIACYFPALLTASGWFKHCKLHCVDADELASVSLHIWS